MEYMIHVQIPIKFLHLAHSMIPLNDVEDHIYLSMSITIVLVGGLLLFLSFQGMRHHIKFDKELFEVNQKREIFEHLRVEQENLEMELDPYGNERGNQENEPFLKDEYQKKKKKAIGNQDTPKHGLNLQQYLEKKQIQDLQ
mmetsp:Transcript_22629/g.21798  ORF Transcript_22629/g.21798 Transcript_22629/m.21798 type:complete len:141 (-) Transcript_22629:2351-2773(-)